MVMAVAIMENWRQHSLAFACNTPRQSFVVNAIIWRKKSYGSHTHLGFRRGDATWSTTSRVMQSFRFQLRQRYD